MAYGAGYIAAKMADATAIIDPRESAVPEIVAIFRTYPHIGKVLPAVGYGAAQLQALATTVNSSAAEVVVSATPIDLARAVPINKKIVRARYEYAEIGTPALSSFIDSFLLRLPRGRASGP
jgi:predicted GTPase